MEAVLTTAAVWGAAYLIATAFFQGDAVAMLLTFGVATCLALGLTGATLGHRLFGLRLRRLPGALPGLGAAALRTLLLCLLIPAVVWDSDGRGLHDKAAKTVLVRS